MAGDGGAPPPWRVRLFMALAVAAVLAWLLAGFAACKHAGLV